MTIARDVGQLLWLGFQGAAVDAELRALLAGGAAGAVVVFRRNLVIAQDQRGHDRVDAAALVDLDRELHAAGERSGEPLVVAVDQEGGSVQRVRGPATRWPPMLRLDRIGGAQAVELARRIGRAIGLELSALGFDVDFAPVLDVHTNPANPIIGERAFATEPGAAADRALAFAAGLAEAGILPCGKHFPGHGDTDQDSHLALPRLAHDMARLRPIELAPFARAAAARLPMIMTAHVVFEALDPGVPATLSRRVITDLLRGELGFEGVVVSDDLDMKALAEIGAGEAAVRAVAAGCDALLLCEDRGNQDAAREALVRAGERDAALRGRIAESAARVRAMKRAFLASRPSAPPLSVLGQAADLAARLEE